MNGKNFLKMGCLFWVIIFYTAFKTVKTVETDMCSADRTMEFCDYKIDGSGSSCQLKTVCNIKICESNKPGCITCEELFRNNEEMVNDTDIKSLVEYEKKIYFTDGNGKVQVVDGSSIPNLRDVYPVLWANKFLFINKSIVYELKDKVYKKVQVRCWRHNFIGKDYIEEKKLSASLQNSFMAGQKRIEIDFTLKNDNKFTIYVAPMNKICAHQSKPNEKLSCTLPSINSTEKEVQTNLTFILDYVRYFIEFEYIANPVINLGDQKSSYYWGGRLLQFQVTNLRYLNCSTCMELSTSRNISENCKKTEEETLECHSPFINATDTTNNSSEEILTLKLDNYKGNIKLRYYPNPIFDDEASIKDQIIEIKGKHLNKAAEKGEYTIIAETGKCNITNLTSNFIRCEVRGQNKEGNVTVELHGKSKTLKLIKPRSDNKRMIIIAAGLVFSVILTLLFLIFWYKCFGQKKKKRFSIPPDDYNGQLMAVTVREGIPFQKMSDYIKRILATYKPPDSTRHNTHSLSENLQHSLRQFGDLLKNKYFLLPTLKALEKDKSLSRSHKYAYAYHLSLLFSSDLRYFLELCDELFGHLASQNRGPKRKTLMLSCSSITEYMILNWLGISMYSHMKENIGDLLYFFTHELKNYFEKMPIDEVTGNSYQYIFERYRLKKCANFEEINIQVEMHGVIEIVKVFSCDTIVQLKKKCMAAFYRGKPASEIPDIDDICVECHRNRIYEFKTEENNRGFTKHLTTDNWNIEEDDHLRLTFAKAPKIKEVNADVRYTTLGSSVARITTKSKRKFIHMQEPEDPKIERPFSEKDFKKINLPVRLEYKLIQLMQSFLNRGKRSVPQRCLYNLFQKASRKSGTEKTWMINSFFIQFCCQFIAKPEILLDISQEMYTKKNLEGMKKYTVYLLKHSTRWASRNPELYANIETFCSGFSNEKTQITELMSGLQSISDDIKRDASFSKEHSLYYLFQMMKTNHTPIITALTKDEKASRLQLGDKFLADIEQIERISLSDCAD